MNSTPIAIIGMACHYPGAKNLRSFWENILTQRRQFRPIPASRLSAADYYDPDPGAPDKTYCCRAALLDGFSFDPVRYRVPRSAFESTDIVHWLALQVALASLEDAGFKKNAVPKERSGVILGNSLTGEYSRAQGLRLRWPFVRRVLQAAAQEKGFSFSCAADLIDTAEAYYKSIFAPVTEDTLAGALSNTIAGRICNYLDLHGGGYTVDGACASSLLAAATAAAHLSNGELDLALAGGVDVSLDTLELVGFAKTAALTSTDMRVYDRRADGFMPGEGCGFVVMQRLEDAVAAGIPVYAVLKGWGISSDGKGGLTAPNAPGQARALLRAYKKAGWNIHDLDFIEGHGTGTTVGDKTELEAIVRAMNDGLNSKSEQSDRTGQLRRCGITSLKSIIGHTKAASGIGALIKAVIAVNRRVLPPTANCTEPHPVFADKATDLYPILNGEIRDSRKTLRAGISGMGFGGINCHLTIESGDAPSPKLLPALPEQKLLAGHQDTELFLVSAPTISELPDRIQTIRDLAQGICEGELADFAAHVGERYGQDGTGSGTGIGSVRAAVTAGSPDSLAKSLARLEEILRSAPPENGTAHIDSRSGICIGNNVQRCRVGFLFPGQGSQQLNMARSLVLRHDWAQDIVRAAEQALDWPEGEQLTDFMFRPTERAPDAARITLWQEQLKQTEIAQPAICLASVLWLEKLARLGIRPEAAAGHSLGELTAFHAAGAYTREDLLKFAAFRGQAMAPQPDAAGTMASLACSAATARSLIDRTDGYAVTANRNSPSQTVISGDINCVNQVCRLAEKQNITARILPVANAFHSQFVASAAQQLAESKIIPELPEQLTAAVVTGIQERKITEETDLIRHFADQVVEPVDFIRLVQQMQSRCDLLVEVGPGQILTGLVHAIRSSDYPGNTGNAGTTANAGNTDEPSCCFPVESEPGLSRDLLFFLAVYFVHGGTVSQQALYEDRLVRPFTPAGERVFLTNPCEDPFPSRPETGFSRAADILPRPEQNSPTESLLAGAAGIPREKLAAYLAQRGRFLGRVVRADLDSMSGNFPQQNGTPELGNRRLPSASLGPASDNFAEQLSIPELLFTLIERRTGFPQESLSPDLRLLDDLNLDSIKASELIAEAAGKAGIAAAKLNVPEHANATLQELTDLLGKAATQDSTETKEEAQYPAWVRDFTIRYSPEPLPAETASGKNTVRKNEQVLILSEPEEQELAGHLEQYFIRSSAKAECALFADVRASSSSFLHRFTTIIALLPRQAAHKTADRKRLVRHVIRLHTIFSHPFHTIGLQDNIFAVIQFGDGFFGSGPVTAEIERCSAKALAASMHLERPHLKVRVLDFSPQLPPEKLCRHIMAELATAEPYSAVGYSTDEIRRVPRPVLKNRAEYTARSITWSPGDVVLVTGGAKGITAECALEFARTTTVQMALVGSSPLPQHKEQHNEILRTLSRFRNAGLAAEYYQCDVTDADAVNRLVRQVRNRQGEITGIIHGSALNRPGDLGSVSANEALEEIAPKLSGALNLCTAVRNCPIKLFVAFSSITGISGMMQNGWYAFSNEALHLLVRRYRETSPKTAVLSIAFSIWDEVGMGVRMGSTARLAQMGVQAISVRQGTARFLRLISHNPGSGQVVVTARTSDLDTFAFPPAPIPDNLQFLEKITAYYPGIEILSRAHLSLERDTYIRHHCRRGTYLFPAVFGLEAMAQAVRAVTGCSDFSSVSIEDIQLSHPITLNEAGKTEIEIHAQVLEQEEQGADPTVQVQIRTAQTDFRTDHFSATFILLKNRPPVRLKFTEPGPPLDINPETDLYTKELLFQGPPFQRIRQIFQLTSERCLFTAAPYPESENEENWPWNIGDPFFRDALLQSGQVSIPRDLCLPRKIERIERYPGTVKKDELLWGKVVLERRTAKEIYGKLNVFNRQGYLVERITGYLAHILEYKKDNPAAEDLAHPGRRDRQILLKELTRREPHLPAHCILPEINSDFIPGFERLNRQERREQELLLLRKTVETLPDFPDTPTEFAWSEDGKPHLSSPSDSGIDLSLTHNQGTVICTVGHDPQGCDLETVAARSQEEWTALLGATGSPLLARLTAQGDSLRRAGTRVWAASETFFKARARRPDPESMHIAKRIDDTVLFRCSDENSGCSCHILTFPVRLTLQGERMLAVTGQRDFHDAPLSQQIPIPENPAAWPENIGSFRHEFTTTFMEGRGPGGRVYFTNIPVWMGELRELALKPVAGLLVRDMKSGRWGMVTNHSSFTADQYPDSYDTMIGKVRLLDDTDLTASFISLGFSWEKKQQDGQLSRIASGRLTTTWVEIQEHGTVRQAPLPEYLQEYLEYLETLSLAQNADEMREKEELPLRSVKKSITAAGPATRKYLLHRQQFPTSREDSNLVGNIYFSHYYSWQARVRDHYLFARMPEQMIHRDAEGEFVCLHAEVTHLQEAMPFETVEVSMYLHELFQEGFTLYFEYYSISEGGERRKLAHGRHTAAWALLWPHRTGRIRPVKMPKSFLQHFMAIMDSSPSV
ncbi:MAG: SDR family NAD(P)-dependent oxidoreductase [Candidatus Electrothrix sp. YB6]